MPKSHIMIYRNMPPKLQDCREHGPDSGAELFLVEGDSAADSVASQRNKQTQAVLPMQGKPMNAVRASQARVRDNPLFSAVFNALGYPANFQAPAGSAMQLSLISEPLRFERLVLLFDPDADGIHSGALMLMFLSRFYPELLASQRVLMVRAPLFRVTAVARKQSFYAASEGHLEHILDELKKAGVTDTQILRYRGLGSLEPELLMTRCIDPQTRVADVMSARDAQMAIEVFGGSTAH